MLPIFYVPDPQCQKVMLKFQPREFFFFLPDQVAPRQKSSLVFSTSTGTYGYREREREHLPSSVFVYFSSCSDLY